MPLSRFDLYYTRRQVFLRIVCRVALLSRRRLKAQKQDEIHFRFKGGSSYHLSKLGAAFNSIAN